MKTYEGQRVEAVDTDGATLQGTVMGNHEGELVVRWDTETYDDPTAGSIVPKDLAGRLRPTGVSALALAFMNAKRRK